MSPKAGSIRGGEAGRPFTPLPPPEACQPERVLSLLMPWA